MNFESFPVKFGSYILLDRIASGGMAEVYRAKVKGAENFQRLLAIKCMRPELGKDPQFEPMFIDEAKLAAQLSHANIVQMYELGRVGERLYIAMELVNGRDLKHVLKITRATRTSVPIGFATYVVHKVAEALDFAHNLHSIDGTPLNIVHRDVSPQNILVSYSGEVKVVDFGIARADQRQTRTQAGVIKGKFAYMAPEQSISTDMDRRVDVFSLGATFYELLTGKQLFGAKNQLAVLEAVRNAKVPSVREIHPEMPAEIDEILAKALAKDPNGRFQRGIEFADALAPFLIDDRTIFGARQASLFMKQLFDKRIEELAELLPKYMAVTEQDCVESSFDSSKTRVLGGAGTQEIAATRIRDDSSACQTTSVSLPANDSPLPAGETLMFDAAPEHTEPKRAVDGPAHKRKRALPITDRSAALSMTRTDEWLPAEPAMEDPRFPVVGLLILGLLGALGAYAGWTWLVPGAQIETVAHTRVQEVDVEGMLPSVVSVSDATVVPQIDSPLANDASAPDPRDAPVSVAPSEPAVPVSERVPVEPGPAKTSVDKPNRERARTRFGFVSVKATGTSVAKVFVDGKEMGYSPLIALRVRAGQRRIKIVELVEGQAMRSKTKTVRVSPGHSRLSPLKVILPL